MTTVQYRGITIVYIVVLLLISSSAFAAKTKIVNKKADTNVLKFEPFVDIRFGDESNVHRSPEKNSTGIIFPQNDVFYTYKYELKLRKYWGDNKLKIEYTGYASKYSSFSVVNEDKNELSIEFRKTLDKKLRFYVVADFDNNRDRGTNILGEALQTIYAYKQIGIKPRIDYQYSKSLEFSAVYDTLTKDYDDTPGIMSLDYQENKGSVEAIYKSLRFIYEYSKRKYSKYLASDENGKELNTNPIREWDYHTGNLELDSQWLQNIKTTVGYSFQARMDLFKDYYTYYRNRGYIKLFYIMLTNLELSAAVEYKSYQYKIVDVPIAGPNPKLVLNYFNADLELSWQVHKNVKTYILYTYDSRDSNKDTGNTYREYQDHTLQTGVRWGY
ncbi:MAG: hypothetical protein WC955_02105 [Elusimicrobiota bacterium]